MTFFNPNIEHNFLKNDAQLTGQYLNTKDLCDRYRCSSRTIFRKLRRENNPLCPAVIKTVGSSNLWLLEDIIEWELSEMRRTQESMTRH